MNQKTSVRRIFANKKPGFDTEAAGLLKDLQETLNLKGLRSLRIYNRYDVAGLSDAQYRQARTQVFGEPPVDNISDEISDFGCPDAVFAVEALPGQYDQRADSAAQCLQILTCEERPICKTARVFALDGEITPESLARIKEWVINPVEARESAMEKPESLADTLDLPGDITSIKGFIRFTDAELQNLLESAGLAMSLADLVFTRGWFRVEGRDPSWTELRVLDTYWSDHCRHTTFLTRIESVDFPFGDPVSIQIEKSWHNYLEMRRFIHGGHLDEKPLSLMDLATLAMKVLKANGKLDDLDESPEINACSIKATLAVDGQPEDYLIMFKNETHNHPTEIEPFGGAATCLGGAIRDPLSGRSYVYQAMRLTGSGDPAVPVSQTLPGKLPQRKITTTAAAGYSSYGNQIGLATGQVEEIYHPGYIAKRMEIGAVIGAAPASQVIREIPAPGDQVILLGGRTGRDGCGGATGSSKAHDEHSIKKCGSEVQKGNPPTERKIQRLFRKPEVARLIRRCNDFGAGGVSVAIGELADGLRIDLDRVPRKYEGLDGTELAISESQERMAVVVAPADADRFIEAAGQENLEAVRVAEVTADPRLVMLWRDRVIVDLARSFIDTHGAPQKTNIAVLPPDPDGSWFAQNPAATALAGDSSAPDFSGLLRSGLSSLAACSRKGLVERFDSSIGAGTVLMPFGGRFQLTPEEGMAALIPVMDGETGTCSLMTFGFDPGLSSWSPYHGAYYAVAQSLAKIAAMGGDASKARLTFQEYFERLTTPAKWGKPLAALLGAFQAQMDFGVPAIGGKDSMSGSYKDLNVPPTLVSFAVQVCEASQVVSACLTKPDLKVWLLPVPLTQNHLPEPVAFMANLALVRCLASENRLEAAATVKQPGAAVAGTQMCFGSRLGFEFTADSMADLFAPLPGSLLLALRTVPAAGFEDAAAAAEAADAAAALSAVGAFVIGQTRTEPAFRFRSLGLSVAEALSAWQNTLEKVFPTRADLPDPIPDLDVPDLNESNFNEPNLNEQNMKAAPRTGAKQCSSDQWRCAPAQMSGRKARPRVFIPVFPGTNTEYDTARSFRLAGGEPDILVIRNLTSEAIRETLSAMEEKISKAQIVMLPGGFSAGDEPEGSGKFIAAAFRNPAVTEQIRQLLSQRDGLMLGICNGFQALIKLGLLPFGDICDLDANSPTLTFNRIGRHVSCYVTTRIKSNRSPWLAGTQPGDLHLIPLSHGEGRFAANPVELSRLAANSQIATQYVDLEGRPSGLTAFNPNGSIGAVEGITSPDGRIFGKMGHNERSGPLIAKNIPGNKDRSLFACGVDYFG